MSSVPYMPFYPADYLADTRHLSTEQHGAYLLLLMVAWGRGGVLPNDEKKLSRIAGVTVRKWKSLSVEVMEFFEVDGDNISSPRMTKEYQKVTRKIELRAKAGRAGGLAKSLKDKRRSLANAMPMLCQPEPEPELEPKSK